MTTPINDFLTFESLGGTHFFPLPNEYEYGYWLPSVVGKNAEGKPYVQLLSPTALREWRMTWIVASTDNMESMQSIWESLSSQICKFIDVIDDTYAVTRHPEQEQLEIDEVKVAGGVRWRVTMRLIKSNDPYEV